MSETIYVVKIEYEVGSDNGEVVELLGAHKEEASAEAAVAAWRRQHDYRGAACEGAPIKGNRTVFYCPECLWGADYVAVTLT